MKLLPQIPLLLVSGILPLLHAEDQFTPVRQFLDASVEDKIAVGGSVVLLHRGNEVFRSGFGFRDLESKAAFEVETPVVIASISKPLLGTLAFRLEESEIVDLSAPITQYISAFSEAVLETGETIERAPTTIELFAHVSGLRSHYAKGGRPWFASWTQGKPLGYVVTRYAKEFPFKSQPGARYAYSGIGTDVAAHVLEAASGITRNELLVKELAGPLGMTKTFYRDAESVNKVGTMASRYSTGKDGKLRPTPKRFLAPVNTYSSSGGAVISTAPDLARWLLMIRNKGRHLDGRYLEEETVTRMLSSFPNSKMAKGGLAIREKDENGKAIIVGHSGSTGTNCWIDFEKDIIAIILTQTAGKPTSFRAGIDEAIYQSLSED